jgi:hypothetical protein
VGDVIFVDCDSGECYTRGSVLIKDLVGESGNALKLATESFDRVRAGVTNMFFGSGSSGSKQSSNSGLYGDNNASGNKDIMSVILTDLRNVLSAKPGSASFQSVASGILRSIPVGANKTSTEEARVQWEVDGEKTVRESLHLLFIYLFGEMDDLVIPSILNGTEPNAQPQRKHGSAFNAADSRSAFDLNTLWARRAQQDSKHVQEFLEVFQHSQMFERFCDERLRKLRLAKAQQSQTTVQKRGFGSSTLSPGATNNQWTEDEDIYDLACAEIRYRRVSITVSTAKQVLNTIKQQQSG